MGTVMLSWIYDQNVGKFIMAFTGYIIIIILIRFINRNANKYIQNADTRYKAKKVFSYGGYSGALLLTVIIFSDQLGKIAIIFGIAGAGIAFALQEVIASVAGWVAISLKNFYSIGDRVQIGGIKGDVVDISILRTTLMETGQWVDADLYNGRIVRIANSFVFKEPVYNYSGYFPFLWDEIKIPVKYGCDHHFTRKMFQECADEITHDYIVLAQKSWQDIVKFYLIEEVEMEPIVTLAANDNWLEFTIRYVVDFNKRRSTKDKLFTLIMDRIIKSNGQVAIASSTVNLVETPRMHVVLEHDKASVSG